MAGAFKKLVWWSAVLFLLTLLGVAGGLYSAYRSLEAPYQGFPGEEITVTVPAGSSVRESLSLLGREGVLARPELARLYWRFVLDDPVLKAGEYRFREATAAVDVLDKIRRGEVLTHKVTLLEGLTVQESAAHLASSGFGELEAFLREMDSPLRVAELDPEASDLEGYIFPDTYAFSRGTTEAQIVDILVATFKERFEDAKALAADSGRVRFDLTPRETVILASIVEKEALLDEERPIIAGVYANRLRRGMGLYADPTIIYALKRAGRWDGNLRRADLQLDSPYNTYVVAGLPPGPIASPGLASLTAALAPADVSYLYFVSRNDGTHVFADTLAEHNRNVYQWQKLYWRKRWAEGRQ